MSLDTPVAFIIFNRPDKAARVFAEIAKAKPKRLFVIADGPRPDRPDDVEKCRATRAAVERVDWDCEVVKNYSDVNLGCGRRPATGISWVFEQVEEAVILEDDCVPHPTFFRFCSELLKRYRDDERIMMVGGFLLYENPGASSYYFSHFPACVGGWATWRRAWRHWDGTMKQWPALRETPWLREMLGHAKAARHWKTVLDHAHAHSNHADFWDYQWMFACWVHGGLCALPARNNLINNIGFDEDSTHTTSPGDRRANLPVTEMEFPLRHPPVVAPDAEFDRFRLDRAMAANLSPARQRLRRVIWATLPKAMRTRIRNLRSKSVAGITQ